MLLDLMKLLFDTHGKAQTPNVLKIGPRERRVIVNGEWSGHSLDVPPRQHTLETVASLIDFCTQHLPDGDKATPIAVWHSDDRVVAVLDDAERLDVVSVELKKSDERLMLTKCEGMATFSQADLVDLLRYKLQLAPELVTPFRTLSWISGGSADADLQFGASRLGRTASASVTGAIQLPDTIPVTIPLFKNLGERQAYCIRCDVDVDSASQQISFGPQPGALQAAIDTHQMQLADRLREALPTCLVYYGSPNLPKVDLTTI